MVIVRWAWIKKVVVVGGLWPGFVVTYTIVALSTVKWLHASVAVSTPYSQFADIARSSPT